jgi:Family of unknown function (DUF5974)
MNEAKDLELDIVDLGDATEVTMGSPPGQRAEANPSLPKKL